MDRFVIPDLHRVFVPASGRLLNWGAPLTSFLLVDVFFSNQLLAQNDLFRCWKETKACKTDLYLLPKQLDEKVASLRLPVHGATLTVLTQEHRLFGRQG